ncbi:MAG: hypothetical protein KIPDCIKN_00270 [Haliscomenobacter sp.]|jgi:hypothetical protein|nr:hypothetical protein [Haliscomenobacter sp.]
MKTTHKEVLFGLYDDESVLLHAVHKAKHDHLEIMDVFTPFPVHGMEEALHLSESRLHIAGFIYGAIGALTGFLAMTWIFTRDWPIIFGGKPYWSVPAFIPITFEMTVLFAAVGMVVTFFTVSGMGFGVTNPMLDDRITDDKFCIAFDVSQSEEEDVERLKGFFRESGASEVNTKTI